jgi:glucose/arabinose dehydrogenase
LQLRNTRLLTAAGRIGPGVLIAIAVVAVLGIGTAGALCKLALNCGYGHVASDAEILRGLQQANANAPKASLPPGFREDVVANGFTYPTDFAFLPGGDVLVAVKNGLVYRVTPGHPGRHVVLDLRSRIATFDYRGIMTVAVSPTFARDRRFYVLYVLRPRGHEDDTTVARFSSFVLPTRGGPATHEHVLVGSVTARTCSTLPATADCLPSDLDHDGAQAAFARDGTIFLATGDGGGHDTRIEPTALQAQNPNSLSGKILHIEPSGDGVPGNPWWNGDPHANRSKVWAIGLRNPFRLTLDPRSSIPIIGDVGANLFEEVDAAPPGANLGWPCYEGVAREALYSKTAACLSLYRKPRSALTWPLVDLPHPSADVVVGGTFSPAGFPPPYRGAYFFGDWTRGWVRYVHIAPGDARILGRPRVFARRAPGPVALHVGPDGLLYYLNLNSGDLRRIAYVG